MTCDQAIELLPWYLNGTLEPGVLIAANNQRIDFFCFHRPADIAEAAVDLFLARHFANDLG